MVKLYQAECTAQKARRKAEAKAREEAERKRVVEKKKKKRMLEYLQQLQDKMLEEDAALLESTEGSQVMESKCKGVISRDKEG